MEGRRIPKPVVCRIQIDRADLLQLEIERDAKMGSGVLPGLLVQAISQSLSVLVQMGSREFLMGLDIIEQARNAEIPPRSQSGGLRLMQQRQSHQSS